MIMNNTDEKSKKMLPVNFYLQYLSDCPIAFCCSPDDTIKQSLEMLHDKLSLNEKDIVYNGLLTCERPFVIKIGTNDKIDWQNELFTIGPNTQFIEYWNDFLAACLSVYQNGHDTQNTCTTKEEKDEFVMIYDDSNVTNARPGESSVQIGNIDFAFYRTFRIPNNDKIYQSPPSVGTFKLKTIDDKLILPMWQHEVTNIYHTYICTPFIDCLS